MDLVDYAADLTIEQYTRLIDLVTGDQQPQNDYDAALLLHPEAPNARITHLLAIRFQQVTVPAILAAPLLEEALLAEFNVYAFRAYGDPYFMHPDAA